MLPRLSPADKIRFEAEIVPHLDVLHRMAHSVCGDADLADDVAQEAFLKALKGFGGFATGTNGRSWLARIAHNTCRDHWRARQRRGEQGWDDGLQAEVETAAAAAAAEPDWQPQVVRDAYDDEIEGALRTLPPRWRMAIQLVDVEGWSYDEAAAGLDIAPGSLRSALHRARRTLYARLKDTLDARPPRKLGESAT